MRTRRPTRPLLGPLLGLVLVAALAGCGGPSEEDQKAADGLSRQLQSGGLTAAEGDCLGAGWVDRAGRQQLVDAGVLTPSLTPARTNTTKPGTAVVEGYVASYFDCVDYGKAEARKFEKTRPGVIDQADFAACANRVDRSEAEQALTDTLLQRTTKVATTVKSQLLGCASGG